MALRVERVPAAAVHPLRHRVLRPHQAPEDQALPGDDAPGAATFAVRDDDGHLVGSASITPEPHPGDGRPGDFRLRGMATDPDRGRGIGAGALALAACVDHARAHGGARVWCNARTPARGFYERAGFAVEGGEFEIAGIGPHFRMVLMLR